MGTMHYVTRHRGPIVLALSLLLALQLGACKATPSVDEVRAEIEERFPGASFEPDVHLRLGPIGMGLVHWLAGMAGEPNDKNLAMARAIRRVEIATYKVRSLPAADEMRWSPGFERRLAQAGWTAVLRVAEQGDRTWLFYRGDQGAAISDLYLVALDGDELALIRINGRLDRLFAEAVAAHPKKLMQLAAGK
jgi:hypothetical protein